VSSNHRFCGDFSGNRALHTHCLFREQRTEQAAGESAHSASTAEWRKGPNCEATCKSTPSTRQKTCLWGSCRLRIVTARGTPGQPNDWQWLRLLRDRRESRASKKLRRVAERTTRPPIYHSGSSQHGSPWNDVLKPTINARSELADCHINRTARAIKPDLQPQQWLNDPDS